MPMVNEVTESDEVVLATLGYKQEFRRTFKPYELFGVVISVFGLLPSIASVLSSSASNGGAVTMVWGWAFGSLFILCTAISLSELTSSAPTSGGLYYMTYMLASPGSRSILCWIVGHASTIYWITAIASVNWGCAVQIAAAANIDSNGQLIVADKQSYGIYAVITLSQAVVRSLGTKTLARLQVLYIACNILLCLVVIIALPIATPKELMNPPSYVLATLPITCIVSGWPDVFAFALGLLAPLWTIGGYDSAMHISEESSNAAIAVPMGIVSGVAVTGILGWVINVVLAFCMGPDLANILGSSVNQPLAQIFLNSFGRPWTLVLWSFVMLTQYIMGLSALFVASRQSFAFARDGGIPFSSLLYRINAYTGTPVNTVWFDCVSALLIGLLSFAGQAAVTTVFTITVTAGYVAYMMPIMSRLVFGKNFKPGPFSLGKWGAPIAAISVTFMLFMVVVLCFPSSPVPQVATMNYTAAVLGGVMLFAMLWYYFPVYGGVHWFQGPKFNTGKALLPVKDER